MSHIKIDSDGLPYWEWYQDTRLDFTVDWTNWVPSGDIVTSATWSVTPTGLTVTSGSYSSSGIHTGWVSPSAGNAGASYVLVSKIFTEDTRQNKRKVRIKILD